MISTSFFRSAWLSRVGGDSASCACPSSWTSESINSRPRLDGAESGPSNALIRRITASPPLEFFLTKVTISPLGTLNLALLAVSV